MATIDNLSIQVTASAESAASALDRLASSAGGLRGAATRAGGGLRDLSAGAKDAGTATQQAGQQAGNAEKHTRNYGRAAEEAGKAAKRGTAGIATFWQALKRIAYYRFIRTIIKEIASAFSEGIKNIYTWSSAVNGHFAKSMNQLATATNYLKNSLGAMTAPLLEALAPAIDFVIDKVVALLNVFNQFFAALSGSSTYTVAKKVAVSWGGAASSVGSSASDANDSIQELKRTILGFDEINKLDKFKTPGSSGGSGGGGGGGGGSSGGGIAFEEKPLEGFFKDLSDLTSGWPDWLKWLFGIGAVAIGAWGISQLPKLIGAIWDALKNLFSIVIPDWFRWLFGPKGDGNVDIDIPDHIDIPDGKIKVDVEKGDWSALDEITGKSVYVSPKLDNQGGVLFNKFEDEWDAARTPLYASPKLDNTAVVLWNGFKSEWDSAGSKTLYMSPRLDNSPAVLYANFKAEWDAQGSKVLYFSPKLDNGADTLYKNFKDEWDAQGSKALYFSPKLDNTAKTLYDGFIKDWNDVGSKTLYLSPKLDNTGTVLWNAFKAEWDAAATRLYASPKLDNTGAVLWTVFKKEWDDAATGVYATPKLSNQGSVLWAAFKKEWDDNKTSLYASPKFDNTGTVLWNKFKGEWDTAATELNVKIKLEKDGWTNIDSFIGFGGATGGGGSTSGGGAGRSDHSRSVPVSITGDSQDLQGQIDSLLGDLNANVKIGLEKIWKVAPLAWLGLDNLSATVSMSMVKTWKNSALAWLGLDNLSATVAMSMSKKWKNSAIAWLGLDDLSATVAMSMSKKWKNSAIAWLGLDDLKSSVDVSLKKNWSGNVGKALGISNMKVTATVSLKKGSPNKIVVAKNGTTTWQLQLKKLGGVFANGIWRNIAQYANGTTNAQHGSLFLAGESGPEMVGHVGGRTEVLNQSQLASTMYTAVHKAMQGVRIDASFYGGGSLGSNEVDYDTLYTAMYAAFTAALAKSDERDKEKVQLLREINAKDFNVDISTSSINQAQTRMNRRAGLTIAPVGT